MASTQSQSATVAPRVVRTKVLRCVGGDARYDSDQLAVEEPLEIALLHGEKTLPLGVTFRTPGDDEALVLGLLRSEGVIASRSDVISVRSKRADGATLPVARIAVRVANSARVQAERFARAFPVSAACGACGKTALRSLRIERESPLPASIGCALSEELLTGLPNALLSAQSGFRQTGGLHAAASFDERGSLVALAEDIGRHNAMDKLVGKLLQEEGPAWDRLCILFSGRIGYDLMQKVIAIGCPLVVSIGAPSSFAVELANLYGITLVGFLRGDRFNVYSEPGRIRFAG